jgi:uncharacterized protein YktB (UPF0637 family)
LKLKKQIQTNRDNYNNAVSSNKDEFTGLRDHSKLELEENKNCFLAKLETEKERLSLLEQRGRDLLFQTNFKMELIESEHNQKMSSAKVFQNEMLEKYTKMITSEKQKKIKISEDHRIEALEYEEDLEREYLEICFENEKCLKAERSVFSKIDEDNKTMKVTHAALLQHIEEHKKTLVNSFQESKKSMACIKRLEADINLLQKEVCYY